MDGILIINKPKNYTSHDVVNIARKALGTKRIGHIGTLDPNATGVLVLCVDKATKLVKYYENHSKKYIATIKLGLKTDTDDITGKVTGEGKTEGITDAQIEEALDTFLGKQKQVPPNYSAVKIKGKKLYELARREFIIPDVDPREVEVYSFADFRVIERNEYITFQVTIHVSKGTYIRAIARDLGEKLGCFGTLQDLNRIEIDKFKLADAISLEDLIAGKYEIKEPFQFLNLPSITVEGNYRALIANGRLLDPDLFETKQDTVIYSKDHEVLAIYYYDETKNLMRMSVKWC